MRFSNHARQRMLERGVDEETVGRVICSPEVTFSDKKGNPCLVREINGRRIKVVIALDDTQFVITVVDLDA
jgi:Domain of unknown function (DUF4258)